MALILNRHYMMQVIVSFGLTIFVSILSSIVQAGEPLLDKAKGADNNGIKENCETLFNQIINLESDHLIIQSIEAKKQLLSRYPTCKHAKYASLKIAENYHSLGMYEEAAPCYESFAISYPDDSSTSEALTLAIKFYIAADQKKHAFKATKQFEDLFGKTKPVETASVVFSTGQVYINSNNRQKTLLYYKDYLKRYTLAENWSEQIQANVFIGDAYRNKKNHDHKNALHYYEEAISLFNKNRQSISTNYNKAMALIATSKAMFMLAEPKVEAFEKVKFKPFKPQKQLPEKVKQWWENHSTFSWKRTFSGQTKEIFMHFTGESCECHCFGYSGLGLSGQDINENPDPAEIKRREEEQSDFVLKTKIAKDSADPNELIQYFYWIENIVMPWSEEMIKTLNEAAIALGEVAKLHIPEWEMAAAAKAGDLQYHIVNTIGDIQTAGDKNIQKEIKSVWKDYTESYRQGAEGAYEQCENIAIKVRWPTEVSKHCQDRLTILNPKKYAPPKEIKPQSVQIWQDNREFQYMFAPDFLKLTIPEKHDAQ